jgi:hypothetical protein
LPGRSRDQSVDKKLLQRQLPEEMIFTRHVDPAER